MAHKIPTEALDAAAVSLKSYFPTFKDAVIREIANKMLASAYDVSKSDTDRGNIRVEGLYENNRNRVSSELFKQIMLECHGDQMPDKSDMMVAHHITCIMGGQAEDNGRVWDIEVVQEYPSADALHFDVTLAGDGVPQRVWGDQWQPVVQRLAIEPIESREKLVSDLLKNRSNPEIFKQLLAG